MFVILKFLNVNFHEVHNPCLRSVRSLHRLDLVVPGHRLTQIIKKRPTYNLLWYYDMPVTRIIILAWNPERGIELIEKVKGSLLFPRTWTKS